MGGGGGGNTTTQTSGVPDWLRPDVERAFGAATHQSLIVERYQETAGHDALYGNTILDADGEPTGERVAGTGALGAQEALARQAIAGEGIYDIEAGTQRQLENLQGAQPSRSC